MCFDAKCRGDCFESLSKDERVELSLNTGLIYEVESHMDFFVGSDLLVTDYDHQILQYSYMAGTSNQVRLNIYI